MILFFHCFNLPDRGCVTEDIPRFLRNFSSPFKHVKRRLRIMKIRGTDLNGRRAGEKIFNRIFGA